MPENVLGVDVNQLKNTENCISGELKLLRLAELRRERKITQLVLAEKIDRSRSTVAMYETGKITPPYKIIKKIKKILNYFEDDLLDEVNKKE